MGVGIGGSPAGRPAARLAASRTSLHCRWHLFDAVVVVSSLVLELSLHNVAREVASLLIFFRSGRQRRRGACALCCQQRHAGTLAGGLWWTQVASPAAMASTQRGVSAPGALAALRHADTRTPVHVQAVAPAARHAQRGRGDGA